MADADRWRRVTRRARSSQPAIRATLGRQLNREDLLEWLVDHGGLAGRVPGVVTGQGWQPDEAPGAVRWVWNSRGVRAVDLPGELVQGSASGEGMRCLLDSLRQLMLPLLPDEQRAELTTDFLAGWLDQHLPLTSEARLHLLTGQQVDVRSVLPVFTTMFQVRVQVFERHEGSVFASELEGPVIDQDGELTPVLRLHWEGFEGLGHFTPVFDRDGPAARQLPVRSPLGAGPPVVAAAWQARREFRQVLESIDGLLSQLDDRDAALALRGRARAIASAGVDIAVNVTAESTEEQTGALLAATAELRALHVEVAAMVGAVPSVGGRPAGTP